MGRFATPSTHSAHVFAKVVFSADPVERLPDALDAALLHLVDLVAGGEEDLARRLERVALGRRIEANGDLEALGSAGSAPAAVADDPVARSPSTAPRSRSGRRSRGWSCPSLASCCLSHVPVSALSSSRGRASRPSPARAGRRRARAGRSRCARRRAPRAGRAAGRRGSRRAARRSRDRARSPGRRARAGRRRRPRAFASVRRRSSRGR